MAWRSLRERRQGKTRPAVARPAERLFIERRPLGLRIRREGAADVRPLVPIEAEPGEILDLRRGHPGTTRGRSRSSSRQTNRPPRLRAESHAASAVRALPTWIIPVGTEHSGRGVFGRLKGTPQEGGIWRPRRLLSAAR